MMNKVRLVGVEKNDVLPIFNYLTEMADESARVPVDFQRAAVNFWSIMNGASVYVAERDGAIVGSLALTLSPLMWYGPADAVGYFDEWFVCRNGYHAGHDLIKRAVADAGGKPILIRRLTTRGADILGYNVVGKITILG